MALVKVSEITLPEHYVRGAIRGSHVKDLLDIVATHNGVKDWNELVGKKIDWPFPEIAIGKNLTPKPVKVKAEKGKKKTKAERAKRWFPFEIIDGAHRWTVAKRLKMKEVEAITRTIDDAGSRYYHQYKTNAEHGLRLDKDTRDNAIRTLANVFHWTQKDLVKETKLDVSSVSRIIAGKQRKEGPRKKAVKKTGANGSSSPHIEGARTPEAHMDPKGFTERLQILINEFPSIRSQLLAFLVANTPKSKYDTLKRIAGEVRDISAIFDDATKSESQPATATAPATPEGS